MSSKELWQKFLENIKEVISPTSFDIWFSEDETSLYSFKDDVATIVVTQEIYKKHLIEHYMDFMLDAMRKAVSYDVTIDVVLKKDLIGYLILLQNTSYFYYGDCQVYIKVERIV